MRMPERRHAHAVRTVGGGEACGGRHVHRTATHGGEGGAARWGAAAAAAQGGRRLVVGRTGTPRGCSDTPRGCSDTPRAGTQMRAMGGGPGAQPLLLVKLLLSV